MIVLITGPSTGVGRSLAETLRGAGHLHPPLQAELDGLDGVASEVARSMLEPFGVDDLLANGA